MGCMRVPAMRLTMASSSAGPVNTLTSAAVEKSGRLTCIPLRRRPASCSSTVTEGVSRNQGGGVGDVALLPGARAAGVWLLGGDGGPPRQRGGGGGPPPPLVAGDPLRHRG